MREHSRLFAAARQLRLAGALILLATTLSGCGTGALWDKFMAKDDTFVDEPADKLYNEGLYLMNEKKDSKAASKKFEEVDREHPYSEWARKSLLMSAYAYYQAGDYDNCIGSATRYVTLHPGSPDAAYAQYLIAASHYDQIPDISRDQGRTEKAMAALEEVIRKYPTSEYSVSSKATCPSATTRRPSTASRPWSPNIRPRARSRKRCSVSPKRIWPSASSARRRQRRPYSGTIFPTAAGTRTHIIL